MAALAKELPFFRLTNYELITEFNLCSILHEEIITNSGLKDFLYNSSKCDVYQNLDFSYYTDVRFNEYIRGLNRMVDVGIFHVNIHSLNCHNAMLLSYLECLTFKFDVIVLSEIWTHNIDLYINLLPDFTFFYDLPEASNIGGVGIFVRNKLNPTVRHDIKIKRVPTLEIENLWIEIVSDSKDKYIIGGIYRHPNQPIPIFNEALSDVFEVISRKNCIIVGDMNIDFLKFDVHSHTTDFVKTLLLYNMLPVILLPTRVTGRSSTLIDHVYTNCQAMSTKRMLKAGNLITDFSDHLSNFLLIVSTANDVKLVGRPLIRIISPTNIKAFNSDLHKYQWDNLIGSIDDPNEAYNKYMKIIENHFEENFPLVRQSRRAYKDKKWMTTGLKKSSNKKHKLYLKWISSKNLNDEMKYKSYKDLYATLIKQAECSYYRAIFDNSSNDIKALWKNLNNLCNPNPLHSKNISKIKFNNSNNSDPDVIVNSFNEYFVKIGEELSSKLPSVSSGKTFKHYMGDSISMSIFCEEISLDELKNAIACLKNKKSSGPDNISAVIIKECHHILSIPLLHIFNKSLQMGIFPEKMKVAKVIPIYKKGDNLMISNYRPISLLNVFSKVFERLVYNRVINFLNKKNLLYSYQFGFRSGFSTSLALTEITEMIYDCLDQNFVVLGLFLDLQKAFDTVNHAILLKKMHHYGIRGNLHKWFESYLSNRMQYTSINDTSSKTLKINCGVPQGSVLGPLLFLIYINDIASVSQDYKIRLFADDSNLFVFHENVIKLFEISNCLLTNLNEWFLVNKLSINLEKTNYMLFKPTAKLLQNVERLNLQIKIGDVLIKRTSSVKYLGIIMDENLTWCEHLDYLQKKLMKFVGIFYKRRKVLPNECRRNLYYAFVHSNIIYGIEIYCNTRSSYLSKIERTVNKLLRILQNKRRREIHVIDLYKNYNTLPISSLFKLHVLKFMHAFYFCKEKLPVVLHAYFVKNSCIHSHNTRNKNDFHVNSVKTYNGIRKITTLGATLWNGLPVKIRNDRSIKNFVFGCKNIFWDC